MSIEINGLEQLTTKIKSIGDALKDIRTLYAKIEEELNVEIIESISSQTSATTGRTYPELTRATMELTGKPKRPALYSRTLGGYPKAKIGGNDATITTNLPYEAIHQFGNPNNELTGHHAPIPARPFLPIKPNGLFTEEFKQKLGDIVNQWLQENMNRR
jgi:phage gpG-like protein